MAINVRERVKAQREKMAKRRNGRPQRWTNLELIHEGEIIDAVGLDVVWLGDYEKLQNLSCKTGGNLYLTTYERLEGEFPYLVKRVFPVRMRVKGIGSIHEIRILDDSLLELSRFPKTYDPDFE